MEEEREKNRSCCISHEFFRIASENPDTIAVIHALGGSQVCRELHQKIIHTDDDSTFNEDEFFDGHRDFTLPTNLIYNGDKLFTFSDILSSVQSLSRRIRHVLDGANDPNLSRPTKGSFYGREADYDTNMGSSNVASPIEEQTPDFCSPKIIGIHMVPSVEYLVAILSVLRCGEAFLPLDTSWPKDRIMSIVSSAKVGLIVKCKSSIGNQLDESDFVANDINCPILYMSTEVNFKEDTSQWDLVWPCKSTRKRTFCYLMYTSGSSGRPKGVCGTEKGLLNRYFWMKELFPILKEETLLFKTPISFVDHLQEFLSAILDCAPLVIPPCQEIKANPLCIVDFVKAYCISRLTIVPSVMRGILLAKEGQLGNRIQKSLRILIMSGEVFLACLWETICKLLPETTILNLYGSTEVSGDCSYFNCRRLPMILETEVLSSVPIGIPIANCNVVLVGDPNEPNEGEIYVGGLCTSIGYFEDPAVTSVDYVTLLQDSGLRDGPPLQDARKQLYFRTGDFAKRLHSGDLVFSGRKDRIIKFNGQRVALEEIENVLRDHHYVVDAAVISDKGQGRSSYLGAYIVLKREIESYKNMLSCVKSWLSQKLPSAMVPSRYVCMDALPMSSTGKVDYALLSNPLFSVELSESHADAAPSDHGLLQVVKKAFCDALMVGEIADDTDFFEMGGNSIAAAQVAHKLGISMRLLYLFPNPSKLLKYLLDNGISCNGYLIIDGDQKQQLKRQKITEYPSFSSLISIQNKKVFESSERVPSWKNDGSPIGSKYSKLDSDLYIDLIGRNPWTSGFCNSTTCSFSRCNKIVCRGKNRADGICKARFAVQAPTYVKGSMRALWKVNLRSCVDASPLVVLKGGDLYLFIGSHSHIFICVDAMSGSPRWEVKLEGRIECSAAIVDVYSQVVVGCYKGKIYFLDFMTGIISWAFQTQGEVKSQPLMDKCRHLIWCGSYDQNLYALDYKNHTCVYTISCGGSIYGSPSIDTDRDMLYVASTKGRVTALSVRTSPFSAQWVYELEVPVFGSLSISSVHGNVICCLVDGHVVALSSRGSVVWKALTDGPIFAGACLSCVLPYQVLVCSRNGSVYSFELEGGDLVWKYSIGDPITSSAFVDESLELISDPSHPSDRLICICGSSGSIYVLRINLNSLREGKQTENKVLGPILQEFAKIDLPGDIFSSPLMIGGRIFVGCRDDYVHCLEVEILNIKSNSDIGEANIVPEHK
ncbi:hypothetical protein MKW98_014740 [Papaver atlanticum]|uniref:Acyl-activating enzyme 19 n=1 Tax=Papaver atlanticum TaxID=357466 RepID=A0AAD4SF77_9MAGN|nr:hypothetical protein MKW98_014740 [Papaver atlanticum]